MFHSIFNLVFALNCWSCNNFNPLCDDPFDASKLNDAEKLNFIYDCTNGLCMKTVSVANIKGECEKSN